jgi:hypothetical protein
MNEHGLTREQLNQLIQLGTLEEEQGGFQQQLERAQAFKNQPGQQRRSPWGAALESVAGLVRGVRGSIDEGSARRSIADVLSRKNAGRGEFANALFGSAPPGAMGAGQPPLPAPSPEPVPQAPDMISNRQTPFIPPYRKGFSPFTIG